MTTIVARYTASAALHHKSNWEVASLHGSFSGCEWKDERTNLIDFPQLKAEIAIRIEYFQKLEWVRLWKRVPKQDCEQLSKTFKQQQIKTRYSV